MFDNLTNRLQNVFRNLAGYGKLTEKNMEDALKQIRKSLLEADVNYKVVKRFIDDIRQKAIGKKIFKTVTPTQMLVKIVYDELTHILGDNTTELKINDDSSVIMLVGLHGSGKTTTCAKLAKNILDKGKRPILVALDIERPAAVEQLRSLGNDLGIEVYEPGNLKNVVDIAKEAIKKAQKGSEEILILDTSGRWHIETDLIDELAELKKICKPQEILLVVDSTTGQDAVNIAKEFNNKLSLTGVILTKVDGDSRGGAALSVKMIAECPIKFIGVGEHLGDLEVFHPDRIASRLLGSGDILTLVEKVEKASREELKQQEKQKKRAKKHELDLEDFLQSIKQIKKIGPMGELMKLMPGAGGMMKDAPQGDKEMKKIEAIINSMTIHERRHPEVLDGSRRKRIADGSGLEVHDINILIQRFDKMKKSMKKMQKQFKKGGFQMPTGGGFPFPSPRF